MFIPRYWSEASAVEHLPGRRRVAVRRFGWSATSQAEADVHARQRLEEALAVVRAQGPDALARFTRRERRVAYSGSDGLPIREEIVEEVPSADAVLTRNGYGVLCLNTPGAMFVDVDEREFGTAGWTAMGLALGSATGAWLAVAQGKSVLLGLVVVGVAAAVAANLLARARRAVSLRLKDTLAWTQERLRAWCAARPDWRVAAYRTPAGVRLLALHAAFDAASAEARAFMRHVGADPLYQRMCELQRCFRARVTPKPWRVGLRDHFKAGGVWPVADAAKLERRRAWVARYDAARRGFAACRFVEEIGDGVCDRRLEAVRRLHDDACGARTGLPIA